MKSFLEITRWKNLLIIAVTMFSVFFFYAHYGSNIAFSTVDTVHFGLLILTTVLIAAGGNVINDIFDLPADRVNKPEKVIIEEEISLEEATVFYWTLNGIAGLISLYLTYYYGSIWLFIVPLFCFGALWIYSKKLKKISFFGNLLVAFLTGIVALYVGIFIHEALQLSGHILNLEEIELKTIPTVQETILMDGQNGLVSFFFIFGLLLNFSREWIKDIQDIEGDKFIGSYSLAIQLGEKKMKMYTGVFLGLTVTLLALLITNYQENWGLLLQVQFPLILVIISLGTSFYFLFHKRKVNIKKADLYLKLSFLFGIILPFWWLLFV